MENALLTLAIAGTGSPAPLAATAENLIFGSGNVAFNPRHTRFFIPWTEKVNTEAGDALDIRLRHGAMLVNPRAACRGIDDVRFFGVTEVTIAGHRLQASRHGIAGAVGLEVIGSRDLRDEMRNAIIEAGQKFGITLVGSGANLCTTIE